MIRRAWAWLRPNLLLILFGGLLILQFLTWLGTRQTVQKLEELHYSVRYYGCGQSYDFPCHVQGR